jgi:hypothetical protein
VEHTKENLSKQKHEKLSFICFIVTKPNTRKKGLFLCDCGELTTTQMIHVFNGHTKTCGHCNEYSLEYMTTAKFGHLKQTVPKNTMPGSNKTDNFTCDCGKNVNAIVANVFSGRTSSCGHCNEVPLSVMANSKFGHLKQTVPKNTMPGSNKTDNFTCDCGGNVDAVINNVFNGCITRCGHCNEIPLSVMANSKFGHLKQTVPKNTMSGSAMKDNFTCDCGGSKDTIIHNVLRGRVTTCGSCSLTVKLWYQKEQVEIKKLKCPVESGAILGGPIVALERIIKTHTPFMAVCPACKNKYHPCLNNIKQGKSLTCGCTLHKISGPAIEISEFIRSLGFEIEFEYKVNKLSYDIFVPSKNLLIEYDGSRFHTGSGKSLKMETKKEKNADSYNYKFLRVKEAKWKKSREETKNTIKSMLLSIDLIV